jgi:hypothetical protein
MDTLRVESSAVEHHLAAEDTTGKDNTAPGERMFATILSLEQIVLMALSTTSGSRRGVGRAARFDAVMLSPAGQ